MKLVGIEWDEDKNEINKREHDLSFQTAQYVFADPERLERLDTSERFHNEIVNSNVRAFLAFFSETLEKGGFYPLTHEAHHELADVHFSVFDYVEMVIRGCYDFHPGNKHFDGEFRRFPSLLIFNLFEAYDWDYNEAVMEQHFMLYIRILQFINFHADKKVSYATLRQVLSSLDLF